MAKREGIMLAYPYDVKRLNKWISKGNKFYMQPKLEGDRCRAVIDSSGEIELISSGMNSRNFSCAHIVDSIGLLGLKNVELDGELYNHEMAHNDIRSIVSRTQNRHPDMLNIQYHVFDIVTDEPQDIRLKRLSVISRKAANSAYVVSVGNIICTSEARVLPYMVKCLDRGYEGIIMRKFDNKYKRAKSVDIMKLKPRVAGEYEIIDYEEEKSINGQLKNALGALWLVDEEGKKFKVGTGFTRIQRINMWMKPEEMIGVRVKIRYQALSDAQGVPYAASFEDFVSSEST